MALRLSALEETAAVASDVAAAVVGSTVLWSA